MEPINSDVRSFSRMLESLGEGISASDADIYNCPLCRDTGWISDGFSARLCDCRKNQEQSNSGLPPKLAKATFANFRLDKYSTEAIPNREISYRKLAEHALQSMKDFVNTCISGGHPHGIILSGPTGCGKTHLVAAAANYLQQHGIEALFLVVPEFLDRLRDSYRRENEGQSEAELIKQAYDAPVLILDDLGAHNFTEWVQNKLFTIINYRLNHELPCLITTNLNLQTMGSSIGNRTVSRLMEDCYSLPLSVKQDIRMQMHQEMK